MQKIALKAHIKEKQGSISSKNVRNLGYLPAVVHGVYGVNGSAEGPLHVGIEKKTFSDVVNSQGELVPFTLQFSDGKHSPVDVILQEIQRDRVRSVAIHCDFNVISKEKGVNVSVPVKLSGIPKGARQGGVLQTFLRKLKVECQLEDLPTVFTLNVTELNIGQGFLISDMQEKYPKIRFKHNPQSSIVILAARSASALKAAERAAKIEEDAKTEKADKAAKSAKPAAPAVKAGVAKK